MEIIGEIEFYNKEGKTISLGALPNASYRIQYSKSPFFDEIGAYIPVEQEEIKRTLITMVDTDKFPYIQIVNGDGSIIARNKKAYKSNK